MEPLSKDERQKIIDKHPDAAPDDIEADIEEYEQLLAERFLEDPNPNATAASLGGDPPDTTPSIAREARLQELFDFLFIK